jgi:hypothetical protein
VLALILAGFLDLGDFLGDIERFELPHGGGLVLFLRMCIAHHHIELGMGSGERRALEFDRERWKRTCGAATTTPSGCWSRAPDRNDERTGRGRLRGTLIEPTEKELP